MLVGRAVFEEEAIVEVDLDAEAEGKAEAGSVLKVEVDVDRGPDKVPEARSPPVEVDLACEPDLVTFLVGREGREEVLSDTLPSSPNFGVGNAENPDNVVDIASTADNEGTFVAFGDGPSPGIFSG